MYIDIVQKRLKELDEMAERSDCKYLPDNVAEIIASISSMVTV